MRIERALIILLAACTNEIGEPEVVEAGGASATPLCEARPAGIDHDAPIFLYYSMYGRDASSGPMLRLANVPGEPVLAVNRPDAALFVGGELCRGLAPEFHPWLARGGKVAKTFDEHELLGMLRARGVDGVADTFVQYLHAGIAYIAIDELQGGEPAIATAFSNGGELSRGLVGVLRRMAERGYDRRVILYSNTYNLVGTMGRFSELMGACRDHCRVFASEIYMTTGNVISPRTEHCHWNLECFERSANGLDTIAPGLNRRTITVLGLSERYNVPSRSDSLCDVPGGGHGALYRQYARLHAGARTSQQPGIGGYALAAVPFPDYAARQAACLERLNGWHGWPRAGGGAGAVDGPAPPGGAGGGDPAAPPPPVPMAGGASAFAPAWSPSGVTAPERTWRPMDVDGDGRDDLVHTWLWDGGLRIHVLFANSDGSFRGAAQDVWPGFGASDLFHFRPADVNGDGADDLVHVWHSGEGIRVHTLMSNGNGTWTASAHDPWPGFGAYDTGSFRPMDVDGDGRDDLVHVWHSGAGIRVHTLFSNGDGRWSAAAHDPWPGFGAYDLELFRPADVNGDGRMDLVHVWHSGAGIRVHTLMSNGNGTWAASAYDPWPGFGAYDTGSWRPMDVDGDGAHDLVHVWHEGTGLRVHTLLSRRDGTWTPGGNDPWAGFGATDVNGFLPADLNGDGLADLAHVWWNGTGVRVHGLVSNGDGTFFATAHDPWPGFGATDVGTWRPMDTDGDGATDLVHTWPHEGIRVHTLRSNRDGSFSPLAHDPWPGFGAPF